MFILLRPSGASGPLAPEGRDCIKICLNSHAARSAARQTMELGKALVPLLFSVPLCRVRYVYNIATLPGTTSPLFGAPLLHSRRGGGQAGRVRRRPVCTGWRRPPARAPRARDLCIVIQCGASRRVGASESYLDSHAARSAALDHRSPIQLRGVKRRPSQRKDPTQSGSTTST